MCGIGILQFQSLLDNRLRLGAQPRYEVSGDPGSKLHQRTSINIKWVRLSPQRWLKIGLAAAKWLIEKNVIKGNFTDLFSSKNTAWKVSKYGVISGPYLPLFGLNTEIYGVNLRIQFEYRKIRTRSNSVFGHFTRSGTYNNGEIMQVLWHQYTLGKYDKAKLVRWTFEVC